MSIITSENNFQIETNRLILICCNKEILETLFKGDKALAALLQINIPTQWTEFGLPAFKYTYDKLLTGSGKMEWWAYLPILKKTRTLLGCCGYKGDPKDGMVEIGYEVAEAYRGWGLATEMAKGLINHAFKSDDVKFVQAHTLAAENESGSVLKKCGMEKMEELEDPEDGKSGNQVRQLVKVCRKSKNYDGLHPTNLSRKLNQPICPNLITF